MAKHLHTDTPLLRKFHFKKLERETACSFLSDFSYCRAAKWSRAHFLSTYGALDLQRRYFSKGDFAGNQHVI